MASTALNNTSKLAEPGVWRRCLRNARVRRPAAILLLLTATALLVPVFSPTGYYATSTLQLAPPGAGHWGGTDLLGRDVLIRSLYGARVSLLVGLIGSCVSLFIGVSYGAVAGYFGGKLDALMMRVVDVLYSVPRLIFVILLISFLDQRTKLFLQGHGLESWASQVRLLLLFVGLGAVEWLTMARIVRGQVLSLKQRPFIQASRALGQTDFWILLRHILPNLTGIVVVYLTLTIPVVILEESLLSFLGLGVQEPMSSWGILISEGAQVINPIQSNWWLLAIPGALMSVTLLALNFLGDALRDILDPRR